MNPAVLLCDCVGVVCLAYALEPCHRDIEVKAVLCAGAVLKVLSLNINGLRTGEKRKLLEKLLYDTQAGICLLTETHLRKPDLETVAILLSDCG